MTIRKTVAISAALLLLVLDTVSAQDEWDALDDDDEEEDSDDESDEDGESNEEDNEKPPEPIEYPEQARDEEGFILPDVAKEEEGVETSSEEEPLPEIAHKEDKPVSVGLLVGYGFSFEEGDMNPFGLGFGIRGGYTFDIGIYAGAKFIYYLGGEEGTKTSNFVTVGVTGGYKLRVDPVFFLPSLELGLSMLIFDDSTGILDDSSNDFYLAPGLLVVYPIDMIFVGLDLSIPIILKDPTVSGLSLMATGGLSF